MCSFIKKYKILLVIQVFILVLLLPLCFKEETLIYSVENIAGVKDSKTTDFESQRFELRPGVYQVRVRTQQLKDGYVYIYATCDESSFRAMRCNGAAIYPEQEKQHFEIYVSETIQSAYVTYNFNCSQQGIMDSLEVYRVNLGERMLTVLFVFACLLLNSCLVLRSKVLDGQLSKEQQIVFWGCVFTVLLAYYPYMTDYFSHTQELRMHLLKIEGLKQALMQGIGYRGDLFLIIPTLLRFCGFSLMSVYKMYVFLILSATVLIAYHSLKECTGNRYGAFLGSVVYTLATYRIEAVYVRGAIDECMAMAFLPMVISGMYRLFLEDMEQKQYRIIKITLILGLSGMLHAHIPTFIMTVAFVFLACAVLWKKSLRKQTMGQLLQTVIFLALINVRFWISLISLATGDAMLYRTHILPVLGWKELFSFGLKALLLAAVPFGYMWIKKLWKTEVVQAVFCGLLILIGMSATYRVNMIAFEKEPFWLYNAENIMSPGMEAAVYLPGDVITGVVLIAVFVLWRYKRRHFS